MQSTQSKLFASPSPPASGIDIPPSEIESSSLEEQEILCKKRKLRYSKDYGKAHNRSQPSINADTRSYRTASEDSLIATEIESEN
jgi:hypothetical protein